MPKNMEMDWDGEWLSPDFVKKWDRNYIIPDVTLQTKPDLHPTRYHVQPNAIRMILPAREYCLWDLILVLQVLD